MLTLFFLSFIVLLLFRLVPLRYLGSNVLFKELQNLTVIFLAGKRRKQFIQIVNAISVAAKQIVHYVVLVTVYQHQPTKQPVTHKVLVVAPVGQAMSVPLWPMDLKPLVLEPWIVLMDLPHVHGLKLMDVSSKQLLVRVACLVVVYSVVHYVVAPLQYLQLKPN